MRQHYGGPKLPKELQAQLGDPGTRRKGRSGGQPNRKDRRKAERDSRKAQKQQRPKTSREHAPLPSERVRKDSSSEDEALPPRAPSRTSQKPIKGILKAQSKSDSLISRSKVKSPSPSPSPLPQPKVSRAVKDRVAQDDAEIAALEKKLGIKRRKKKTKEVDEDDLGNILGDLGSFSSDEETSFPQPSKRKRGQDDEWLANKRRKALGNHVEDETDEGSDSESDDEDMLVLGPEEQVDEDIEGFGDTESDDNLDDADLGSDFNRFESDADEEEQIKPRVRENPYVAPVTPASTGKYVPPALRAPPSSDTEALARLRRQIQGLLNRLSDANLITILRDVEQIYQTNPRGYVTTTLVDLLMGLLADETTLLDTFLILHAGFIASIYKVIGPDFGAQMTERIVSQFDAHYDRNKDGNGKQTTNLISVVAELYCFQVIGSNLVFDYIRLFLDELSEINTELLLRIVRVSGSQLRQDNPTSLKDIVLLLQKSVAKVGESNLPVRTKFMIETINDLKNNRLKTGVAASAITSEHTVRMKKQLGTLNTRNLKGTEPLRIGLADIRDTEKKGKWWLVGASWRSNMAGETPGAAAQNDDVVDDRGAAKDGDGDGEVNLLQLAREQRMNTDVRRAIFITIMSASDYKDAHIRLLKLNLKKAQAMEIPRVIVHCAGCENTYNPYYTLLAQKFCSDHKLRKCFQFALWDVFKTLGEKKDDANDSDDEESNMHGDMSLRRLVNLGKLYGTLIAKGGLSITSLKILNFPYLRAKTRTLIEVMLVTVILESQKGQKRNEKALLNVFINADAATEMIAGLQYILKRVVSRTEITANKRERETVKWACKLAMDMLQRLMATATLDEDD